MKVAKLGFILSSFFGLTALVSCIPDPHYPNIPFIEYKSFMRNSDGTADLTIRFTDGDGNIRTSKEQTAHNLFIYYMVKDSNGDWVLYDPNLLDSQPAEPWGYTTPVIDESYGRNGIEGEIITHIIPPNISSAYLDYRMECVLQDQSGNISNRVSSPVLHP